MQENMIRRVIYRTHGDMNELVRMYISVLERVEEIVEALKKRGLEGDEARANAMMYFTNGYKNGNEIRIVKEVYEKAFSDCYPEIGSKERTQILSVYKALMWINAEKNRGVAKKQTFDGPYYICYRLETVNFFRAYVRVQEARNRQKRAAQ